MPRGLIGVVREGDRVQIGRYIAASGNSGNTLGEPHLHFGVYQSWPAIERFDVPVNFANAQGPSTVAVVLCQAVTTKPFLTEGREKEVCDEIATTERQTG